MLMCKNEIVTCVTNKIKNIDEFEFKKQDKYYLEDYKIYYYFKSLKDKRKIGVITNINYNGYVTIAVNNYKVTNILSSKIDIYIDRDEYGKIYFYSYSNLFLKIDIHDIEEKIYNLKREDNKMPELKIRYHREMFPAIKEVVKKSNFYDIYSAEDVHLKAGQYALINLGISVECPPGYWLQFVPRSSTFKNYKIIQTNSFAVIDTTYCGDNDIIKMPVYAMEDTIIPANERICQFTLVKDVDFEIVEVEKLENVDRGGIGSTGKE